jgi:prophage endopeptidase
MNIQLILIGVILSIASSVGTYFYGHHEGQVVERAAWEARENKQLALANQVIQALQQQARETERKHAADLNIISTQHETEITNVRAETKRLVDAAVRGSLKLRIPAAAPSQASASGTGQTTASASGRDGSEAGELPAETSRFLLELTGEADEVVKQLTACQATLTADRAP